MSDLNFDFPPTEELLLLETNEVYARIPQLQDEYMEAFEKLRQAILAGESEAQKQWFDECARIKQEQIDAGVFVRRYLVKKAYRKEHSQ